jgi:Putative peptidoglycan binding domain
MANPELRRDSPEHDWVEYLQKCLDTQLQADAEAGNVRLSRVDGLFGPITEESVKYLQRKAGLTDDGIVGDSTWQVLEGSAPATPGGAAQPVTKVVPFTLKLRWQDTTFDQIHQDLLNLDLATHPAAKLDFQLPVGKLISNGGITLLHREIHGWSWWLEWSTKGVLDYSKKNGIELGTDNHAELGVRPLRGVDLTLEGNLKLRWAPGPATGDISGDAMLKLKFRFDWLGGASR